PIILITNPLDVNVHIAATEFDYPTTLIVGTGTALDSARLRRHLADWAGVSPDSVQAFMLGEHGATAFPYLSHASIGGLTLAEATTALGLQPLSPEQVG
ncbi:lactate dehydrogenase, partial [Cronobacter sakazakii]